MDLSFYKSYISEEIRAEGERQRAAKDVLTVLTARGIHVSAQVCERITNCDDPEILDQWLIRAATAPSAEEIFTDE
ncbi:hypothetical protein [Streptomyces coeruleorubidus]|uniref:hypothetical protein n=1 Tax=Streptomyces coeruleorubidus TaxID=116188 RepID=UPI00365C86B5